MPSRDWTESLTVTICSLCVMMVMVVKVVMVVMVMMYYGAVEQGTNTVRLSVRFLTELLQFKASHCDSESL